MFFKKIVFLINFLSFCKIASTQVCMDTSFKKNYNLGNINRFWNNAQIEDSNGDILTIGNLRPNNTNFKDFYFSKLSSTGTPIFLKKIFEQNPEANNLGQILELSNGNYLLLNNSIDGSGTSTLQNLILINSGGSLVKTVQIKLNYPYRLGTHKVIEASNGIIFLLSTYGDANTGDLDVKLIITKLDLNTNTIIWNKVYSSNSISYFGVYPISFELNNNSLYIIGMPRLYSNTMNIGNPNNQLNLFSLKLNANTGNIINSKSYLSLRDSYFRTDGNYFFIQSFNKLQKIDESKITYVSAYRNNSTLKYGFIKTSLDTNLSFTNSYLFNRQFNGYDNRIRVQIDNKDNLLLSFLNLDNLYTAKVDTNLSIKRSLKFASPTNTSYYRSIPITTKNDYLVFSNYFVDGFQNTTLEVLKFKEDAPINNCYGTDTNFIKKEPVLITEYENNIITQIEDLPMQISLVSTTVIDFPIIMQDVCYTTSACSNITLTGPTQICDTSLTYTYIANKNAGCNKYVAFTIDTAVVSYFNQLNDTTVQLKFKANFTGKLYANISSCSLADSLNIQVQISPTSINLGNDTTLCSNQTILLNAKKGFINYQWQNGTTDSTLNVTTAGTYYVNAFNLCGQRYTDTIVIGYTPIKSIHLGNDTSICQNTMLTLQAGIGFTSYLWNTGSTQQTISINQIGTYNVVATYGNGCTVTDTITIPQLYSLPVFTLNKKNIVCLGQNNTLSVATGLGTYNWSNGTTTNSITILQPGLYKLTVTNSNLCTYSDSVQIIRVVTPPKNFLPTDTAICNDEDILIMATTSFKEYLWSTSSTANSITTTTGQFWLQVKDFTDCIGTDSIKVSLKDCSTYFYMPTAFTPNGDGVNDVLKPTIGVRIEKYSFSVYNRFGQEIFKTNNPFIGWNGLIKGMLQNNEVFIWTCTFKAKNEKEQLKKGTVVLLK